MRDQLLMVSVKNVNMSTEGAGNYGFDCLLIDLVRQNDVLWRKSNPDHFNETAKKKTWQVIAQALNESVEFCTHRWIALRTKYVRKLKQFGPGGGDESSWPYMEEMSFLNSVIKHRNSRSNAKSSSQVMQYVPTPTLDNDAEASVSTFPTQSAWGDTFTPADIPGFCVAEVNNLTNDIPDSPAKRMRTLETNSESTSIEQNQDTNNDLMRGVISLIKLTTQQAESNNKKTANEHFCESISLQLQDILDKDPRQSNAIKIKIMNFVSELSESYVFNSN